MSGVGQRAYIAAPFGLMPAGKRIVNLIGEMIGILRARARHAVVGLLGSLCLQGALPARAADTHKAPRVPETRFEIKAPAAAAPVDGIEDAGRTEMLGGEEGSNLQVHPDEPVSIELA